MPEWIQEYKRELLVAAGILLVGMIVALASIDNRSGIAIKGTDAGFSAQEIKSWTNASLLNSPDAYNRKDVPAGEVCPNLRPVGKGQKVDCAKARREVEQNTFQKLTVQAWAQAQAEKDGIQVSADQVATSERALQTQLIAQTRSRTLEEALRKSGLTRADLRHRAQSTAAFNAQLPPVPAPPNRRQIQNTYNNMKKALSVGPAGSLKVWQYASKAQAQQAAGVLRSGSSPSRAADVDLQDVPYKTAKGLPSPWGDFIQRPAGVYVAPCSIRWCAVRVYQPSPARPAPPLSQVAAQIRDNMIFEVRNMQIQDLGSRLAREWSDKTSCSDLSVCS